MDIQINPGQKIPPVTKKVTQGMINKWASVSGDFNPVHVDPDFAGKTRFGGTIAHGHISIAFICEMMTGWLGKGWMKGGVLRDIRFTAPVRPGYTVISKGVVKEISDTIICDIWLENQDGEKCVVAKVEIPISH